MVTEHGYKHDDFGDGSEYLSHKKGLEISEIEPTLLKHGYEYEGNECQSSRGRNEITYYKNPVTERSIAAFHNDSHKRITGIQIDQE